MRNTRSNCQVNAMQMKNLLKLEENCATARGIALERLRTAGALSTFVVDLLRDACDAWFISLKDIRTKALPTAQVSEGTIRNVTGADVLSASDAKKDLHQNTDCHGIYRGHRLDWLVRLSDEDDSIAGMPETMFLLRVLQLQASLSSLDPVLAEEMGREGAHIILCRLIQYQPPDCFVVKDSDLDVIYEVRDLACEIGSHGGRGGLFPMRFAPFTLEERLGRLPLVFDFGEAGVLPVPLSLADRETACVQPLSILINQIHTRQSAQDDVGFVMWPSAVILGRFVAKNSHLVRNRTVLELGAGCGLAGLVAAKIHRKDMEFRGESSGHATVRASVIETDFNDAVLCNLVLNIRLNELSDVACTAKLDFYMQDRKALLQRPLLSPIGLIDATLGTVEQEGVDLVLAADVICKASDAMAVAKSIRNCLRPNGVAFMVCADTMHRFGVDKFIPSCHDLDMIVESQDVADLYNGALLRGKEDLHRTCGYVQDMTFTLFKVTKGKRVGHP